MKNKILTFIIGLLVGAIITTAAFYIYLRLNKNENNTGVNNQTEQMGMPGEMGQPPEMQNEENGSTDGNTTERKTPPAKPDGENSDDSSRPTPTKIKNGENQKPTDKTEATENNA